MEIQLRFALHLDGSLARVVVCNVNKNQTIYGRAPHPQAVTQELMLYWLQQLQVKRWQHRQTSTCPDPTNNNNNNTAGKKQTKSAVSEVTSLNPPGATPTP